MTGCVKNCGEKPARTSIKGAAIIDSQSVKTDEQADSRGYDAGKKVKGRKRHILVDTLGLLLTAKVLTADIQDRDAAKLLLTEIKERMPRLQLIWADGGYRANSLSGLPSDVYGYWKLSNAAIR